MKSRKIALKTLVLAVMLCLVAGRARAEMLRSDSGFYVDLPEGFTLESGDGKSRFGLVSPDGGLEFDILAYDTSRYPTAETLSKDALAKIGSQGQIEDFAYQGRACVFAELAFPVGGSQKQGYAIFIGPPPAGGPARTAQDAAKVYALLAYADAGSVERYGDFILSCLDCFSPDRAALRAPGPVSQYLLPWPAQHDATKTVAFGDARLDLPWSDAEAQQEEDTAGREFRVLQAYAQNDKLALAAWARAYRMIYRECAARLDRLAIEIDRLLPDDPTAVARAVLQWTQGFTYERGPGKIDFTDPLTAAYEARGDCDSRAMVAAILLERRGIDAILMVSEAYSHALLGVDVPGGGQRFNFDDKGWLVGETTAKVGLGMIAADQADWSKWLGIRLAGD